MDCKNCQAIECVPFMGAKTQLYPGPLGAPPGTFAEGVTGFSGRGCGGRLRLGAFAEGAAGPLQTGEP